MGVVGDSCHRHTRWRLDAASGWATSEQATRRLRAAGQCGCSWFAWQPPGIIKLSPMFGARVGLTRFHPIWSRSQGFPDHLMQPITGSAVSRSGGRFPRSGSCSRVVFSRGARDRLSVCGRLSLSGSGLLTCPGQRVVGAGIICSFDCLSRRLWSFTQSLDHGCRHPGAKGLEMDPE